MEKETKEQSWFRRLVNEMYGFAVKWAPALKVTILLLIMINAAMVRVFSVILFYPVLFAKKTKVIRYESVIHEFDPWFNFRTTKYLSKEGLFALWDCLIFLLFILIRVRQRELVSIGKERWRNCLSRADVNLRHHILDSLKIITAC